MKPKTFSKIITLGTKFNWSPYSANKEVRMLQPDIIEEKVPKFVENLKKIHHPNDWKLNMNKTAQMMLKMGQNPPLTLEKFKAIKCPITLLLGSDDTMVSKEETLLFHQQLSNSSFELINGVEHPIEKLEISKIQEFIQ